MKERTLTTWNAVLQTYQELQDEAEADGPRWLFRGVRDSKRCLRPSLERQTLRFRRPIADMRKLEAQLLREFKRHYPRYVTLQPDEGDDFRWLALIQHHGGPTRLLDFTYSFYAGLYFALRHAGPTTDAALWLIDHDGLWELLRSRLDSETLEKLEGDPTGGKSAQSAQLLLDVNQDGVMPVITGSGKGLTVTRQHNGQSRRGSSS